MSDICSKCGFDMDAQFEARARLIDKLEAYEKGCANLESEIVRLRQENAQLKAELLCKETEWAKVFESLKAKLWEIQTSAEIDPNTAIAYGLYPSSARPVNPNPSKSENWVGYTPIDPQTK